jgi:MraZ protein
MELKTGSSESTLDDKGRLSIPVRFREQFQGKLIITRGLEPYVWIMTPPAWENLKKNMGDSDVFTPEELRFFRDTLIYLNEEVKLDKVGRIAIPSSFRSYANLTKDCLVICAGDRLSVWDSGEFITHTKRKRKFASEAMNKLGPGGIFSEK